MKKSKRLRDDHNKCCVKKKSVVGISLGSVLDSGEQEHQLICCKGEKKERCLQNKVKTCTNQERNKD